MSKSTAEIRQMFLDFFHSKGHQIVPSSSLVPHDDPTLLFTNAGMNQFKDVFLGKEKRNYTRATTAQRCVRAGGKHNDLENVGYTARHHTFFEMLGNFSFGDYFKQQAIAFAWELLTDPDWFNLPKERLWITVYATDDEAYSIWANEIGVAKERIIRIGDNKGAPYASDNFWQMGDTGPCGPCTEIFYDHGEHLWGGPPGSVEEDGDRFIEIWNIVFMQFNRQQDSNMQLLPTPSVDTGMGLERIAAVLQHVNSNYDIDLFNKLIHAVAEVIGTTDKQNKSLRVIADHIRSCAFLISDGVLPSNEGRGYVLRRIIRRAVRHGNILGTKAPFFYRLVSPLIDVMESAADELCPHKSMIENTLKSEEEQFVRTLERGLVLLDEALAKLDGDVLDGNTVFKLYDTYGFPADLTADICRDHNIRIDEAGFDQLMEQQRQRARQSGGFQVDYSTVINVDHNSHFSGYKTLQERGQVVSMFKQGQPVDILMVGDEAIIILDTTPFYAESGGQVGDQGEIRFTEGNFAVIDTKKYGQAIGHHGRMTKGTLTIGTRVQSVVDMGRRQQIRLNHSSTHLLHAALRQELGNHILQKGSLVNDHYLRFDFSQPEAITEKQLRRIEDNVNHQIRRNLTIVTEEMALADAKNKGAMALFGEKYDEHVRVLTMGDFSIELCGGTHAARTGDIGLFRIISEFGIAAGIRRIEAVTGEAAINYMHSETDILMQVSTLLKSDKANLIEKLIQQIEQTKQLEKSLQIISQQQVIQESVLLVQQAQIINGTKVIVAQLDNADAKKLRLMTDELKNRLQSGVIILASTAENKVSLIVGVTKDLTGKFKAGEIVAYLAEQVGGKGGGRPDMAQAGGVSIAALPAALQQVIERLKRK